jgi:galactokinase
MAQVEQFILLPGRINLIGEHTDYNDGFVFPGAVDKGIVAEIKKNGKNKVLAYSIDLKDFVEFGLKKVMLRVPAGQDIFSAYAARSSREVVKIEGFNTAFAGDVPLGAGMSSSAALESTYAFALNEMFNCGLDKFELGQDRSGYRT